jgi:hypothetical protein
MGCFASIENTRVFSKFSVKRQISFHRAAALEPALNVTALDVCEKNVRENIAWKIIGNAF